MEDYYTFLELLTHFTPGFDLFSLDIFEKRQIIVIGKKKVCWFFWVTKAHIEQRPQ